MNCWGAAGARAARREGSPPRFPITLKHVIGKESLKIKMLEQVLIKKIFQLFFLNLLYSIGATTRTRRFTPSGPITSR